MSTQPPSEALKPGTHLHINKLFWPAQDIWAREGDTRASVVLRHMNTVYGFLPKSCFSVVSEKVRKGPDGETVYEIETLYTPLPSNRFQQKETALYELREFLPEQSIFARNRYR